MTGPDQYAIGLSTTDVELAVVIAGELVHHGGIRPTEAMRLAGHQMAALRQTGALGDGHIDEGSPDDGA